MKKFTVKDFIEYNNPCIVCNSNISISFGSVPRGADESTTAMLRPTIKKDMTEIDLKVSYNNTLTLWIYHITNKFRASNSQLFEKYLEENSIFLASTCNCGAGIHSEKLDFNHNKSFIKPVGISAEAMVVIDDNNVYTMVSSFFNKETILLVNRRDKVLPLSPTKLDLPLLPRYKFKNREHLLTKLRTYITFS